MQKIFVKHHSDSTDKVPKVDTEQILEFLIDNPFSVFRSENSLLGFLWAQIAFLC
jgi:hypothetical protein